MNSSLGPGKTVLLVDDHPLFRKGVKDIITSRTRHTVVAEADNGVSALTLAQVHKPDIIVIDLALPDMNGLSVIKNVRNSNICTQFVILTLYNDLPLINEALSLNVIGYLMKSDGVDILQDCLENVHTNDVYLSPSVSVRQPEKPLLEPDSSGGINQLTDREVSVLVGISEHLTSREIALRLNLSVRTVQNHRARIMRKLGLQGGNSLYRFALEKASLLTREQ